MCASANGRVVVFPFCSCPRLFQAVKLLVVLCFELALNCKDYLCKGHIKALLPPPKGRKEKTHPGMELLQLQH